jgi:ATP-binding cassette, subfamily A (ABC1), member 3
MASVAYLCGQSANSHPNPKLTLWFRLAYLIFDGLIVLFISAVITIVLVAQVPDAWYNIGSLFVCLFFYGIASINLSYVISLFSKSQLSAFAFSAGGQAYVNPLLPRRHLLTLLRFMLLMYMSAYMSINSRSPPEQIQSQILIVHFTLGLITPIGQLLRALIIGLNLFSVLCVGAPPVKSTNYSGIKLYGGPILYLIGQSLLLFGFLIWYDHGFSLNKLRSSQLPTDTENTTTHEKEVSDEIARASTSDDGLRILHTRKTFKSIFSRKVQAVDDLTFGVKRGEVFALVGPNGGL